MPLDWKDIRDRATVFARDWRDEKSERAEAQTFWNEFLEVFGVKRRRVAVFEKAVGRLKYGDQTNHGRIDVLWPGVLLAEHKSAGHDLNAAFLQASDYFAGLADRELPAYVIVSDFARIRLYDLEGKHEHEFALKEFPKFIYSVSSPVIASSRFVSTIRSISMPSVAWASCMICLSATVTAGTSSRFSSSGCCSACSPTTPASFSRKTRFMT